MSTPGPIIYLDPDTNEFKLDEAQYNRIFNDSETKFLPVVIVSIAGDCRKGKSFLLNFFLRYLMSLEQNDPLGWTDVESESFDDWIGDVNKPLEGFSWKSGVDRDTVGIIIWPRPLIVTRSDGTKLAVLLMDTQGLFDDGTEHRDVGRFFAISSLISSIQIYNQMTQFQSNDLTTLCTFSSYGKRVSGVTGHKAFQKLLILLRDWPNPGQFNFGHIGGQEYLEYKRQRLSKNFGSQWKELRSCYEEIDCFLLPSIGDDACTDLNFDGRVNMIRSPFIAHLNSLFSGVLCPDKLVIKTLDGVEQQLWMMGTFICQLTDKLKDNDSVQIDYLLSANNETRARNASCEAFLRFIDLIEVEMAKKTPISKETLYRIEQEAITIYWNRAEFIDNKVKDEVFKALHKMIVQTREKIESSNDYSWFHKLSESFKKNIGSIGKFAGGALAVVGTIGAILLGILKSR